MNTEGGGCQPQRCDSIEDNFSQLMVHIHEKAIMTSAEVQDFPSTSLAVKDHAIRQTSP
jgi:hypothetical protein